MSSRHRVVVGVLGAVATAVLVPVAAYVTILSWLTCDGDGGYPYADPASAAGRFCDSPASTPYFLAQFTVPLAIAMVATVLGVRRRRLGTLAKGAGIALAVLVGMGALVVALPTSCSEEQRQTLEPHECESY